MQINNGVVSEQPGMTIPKLQENGVISLPFVTLKVHEAPVWHCRGQGAEPGTCLYAEAADGMKSSHILRGWAGRKDDNKLMLSDHPDECLTCGKNNRVSCKNGQSHEYTGKKVWYSSNLMMTGLRSDRDSQMYALPPVP